MHSRTISAAGAIWTLALVSGCQSAAEIGWTLGPLNEILPLSAQVDGSRLQLRLALTGWGGRSLGPESRVRTQAGTLRLRSLTPGDAVVAAQLRGGVGDPTDLRGSPGGLSHLRQAPPSRVLILLDNSTAAAAADPSLARLAGVQAFIDRLSCPECPSGQPELTLLVMRDGTVARAAGPARDPAGLAPTLQSLARGVGGSAPLWDGLLLAVRDAQAVQGVAAVLVYTAGAAAGPSTASAAEVRALLAAGPTPRLLVVQQQGQEPELVAAARQSQGLWMGPLPGGLETTMRAAAAALEGCWALEWSFLAPTPEQDELLGELELRVGSEARRATLDLTLLR